MSAEPPIANLQADQMRCLVAWINTRSFCIDNVKMNAVTASDGFSSYAHIELICCDAKTRLLTHPTHYARSIQVTADGRIHVPQQLRQVAPSWSDADAGPHTNMLDIKQSIENLLLALRDVSRCGVTSTRKVTREYTLASVAIPARDLVDVLNFEVQFQPLHGGHRAR